MSQEPKNTDTPAAQQVPEVNDIPPLSADAEAIINQQATPTYSQTILVSLFQAGETLISLFLGFSLYFIYLGYDGEDFILYTYAVLFISLLHLVISNALHTHSIIAYRTVSYQTARVLGSWTGVFLLAAFVALFLRVTEEYSRVWFGFWFLLGIISLIGYRYFCRSIIWRWTQEGHLSQRAVIIGGGEMAESLITAINNSKNLDVEILGLFDDRTDDRSPPAVAGYKKLGSVDQLVEFARKTRIDIAIVSLPITAEKRVAAMLKKIWVLPVDVRLSAHSSELKLRPRAYSYVGEVPLLDIMDKPMADWDMVLKWTMDMVIATLAIILLSPVMLVTALIIKFTSKGPIIFKQKRFGFNNELIEVYKFRSMYTEMTDAKADKLVTKDDPRVTPIGRIIRKTSLDELPQLFNVLKGQLSLVGPRPHAESAKVENQLYYDAVDGYFARHKVKPGITGWAQINGWRGETDTMDKIMNRIEFDLYYIENYSIFLDFYVLAITPFALLTHSENAY